MEDIPTYTAGLTKSTRAAYRSVTRKKECVDVTDEDFYREAVFKELPEELLLQQLYMLTLKDKVSKIFHIKAGKKDISDCFYYIYVMGPAHRSFDEAHPYGTSKRYTVVDYVSLPHVLVNRDFNLAKIIILGLMGDITYGRLMKCDPDTYQDGTDPELDYMPSDVVKPVVLIDSAGFEYRTNEFLWLRLNYLSRDISTYFDCTGERFLPRRVYIDPMKRRGNLCTCKWLGSLSGLLKAEMNTRNEST